MFDYACLWLIARPLNEHRAVNLVRNGEQKNTERMRERERENKEEKQTNKIRNKITTQMK